MTSASVVQNPYMSRPPTRNRVSVSLTKANVGKNGWRRDEGKKGRGGCCMEMLPMAWTVCGTLCPAKSTLGRESRVVEGRMDGWIDLFPNPRTLTSA